MSNVCACHDNLIIYGAAYYSISIGCSHLLLLTFHHIFLVLPLFNALLAFVNSSSESMVNSCSGPRHCLYIDVARSKYDFADIQSPIFLYTSPILCSVLAELLWSTPNSRS